MRSAVTTVPVPPTLLHKNIVIEILSQGKQEFRTFYSNELKVQVLENYGELRVLQATTGRALPQVYVKVFAQGKYGRSDFFFRDGYTDMRGKFDYAQTNGGKLKDVRRFAILVQSDKYGAKIQEVAPPKDLGDASDGVMMQENLSKIKMVRLEQRRQYVMQKKGVIGKEVLE